MIRKELLPALCTLALVVGVSQAQEKQTKTTPKEAPRILYIPSVPPTPELTLQLAGLEAVGCKVCTQAVQAAEAKGNCCNGCEGCAAAKKGGGCEGCAKSKIEGFAVDCAAPCAPAVKKTKKTKKNALHDYFFIATPPPAPPMPPQYAPPMVYAPAPPMTADLMAPPVMPAPDAAMMVIRAASKSKARECTDSDSAVQQTKNETHGSISIGFGFTPTGVFVPGVQVTTQGELEIECSGGCIAKCERMSLNIPSLKEWTIAPLGKQVVISGPSLQASCDSLAQSGNQNGTCLILQGHVHLRHGKSGMKADVESDHVCLIIRDGKVDVHTVTAP